MDGGGALWQGFDFAWRAAPHRLNHIASVLRDVHADATGVQGTHAVRFSVGRVPDRGLATTLVTPVRADGAVWVEGTAVVELCAELGRAVSRVGAPVEVPLPPGLRPRPEDVAVLLRGFDLACTSHPAGVHPEGFGVRLTNVAVSGDTLQFTPRLFVAAGNSPDVITSSKGAYAYRFTLPYAVLAGPPGALRATPATEHLHRHARGPTAPGTIDVLGVPAFSHAAFGVRGFAWRLVHRARSGRNARFLRRLRVEVGGLTYDPASGAASGRTHLEFSNRGLIAYGCDVSHRLWPVLVQLRGAVGPQQRLDAAIPTGIGAGSHVETPFACATSPQLR